MGASGIWTELSSTLKALRVGAGVSLRQVESRSGIGRGTLSSVENAKAKPSRVMVEWYDREFGGDGLPLTMYAEARSAHGSPPRTTARRHGCAPDCDDVIEIQDNDPARGGLVVAGAPLTVRWRLRNLGTQPWTNRLIRRIGVGAAPGLIGSEPYTPVPDTGPGATAELSLAVRIPAHEGSYAAYWEMVHEDGVRCAARNARLDLLITVAQ